MLEAKVTESIVCDNNPHNQGGKKDGHDIKPKDGKKAIDHWCNQDLTLSPTGTSNPPGTFSQNQPNGLSYDNYATGLEHYVIRSRAFVADKGDIGLGSKCSKQEPVKTKGEECKRKMKAVLDKCGSKGGMLTDNTTKGCVSWSMFGQKTGYGRVMYVS
ncbi:hypothetical protein EJ08DRAFT_398123 [Tothia fuscella]|uniref:Uncharacterized protein n=1 Tax=Tothia fuscella TaxID=1048955 RepID=A0A9P4NL72_9PEZI|nr:hypothetical protein EJ08DRAFT_398123 [Tothia fuscella]